MSKHRSTMRLPVSKPLKFRDVPDYLVAHGRYLVSAAEVAELVEATDHHVVHEGLRRLRQAGKMFSPARGFYGPVPPQYRSWGVVPADWFIDSLMTRLGRRYYVGLLSAAAMHGAAHQAPLTYQVLVDRQLAHRDRARLRLRFHVNSRLETAALEPYVERLDAHAGPIAVSGKELTAVDVTDRPDLAGGLDNAATVLAELSLLEPAVLDEVAALYPRATVRRLGWLLEAFTDIDVSSLQIRAAQSDDPTPLDPAGPKAGSRDRRWGLIINADVHPDV